MPRHPPIALKTLDRSHCQCSPRPETKMTLAKRPASRDQFGGAVRQPIICRHLSNAGDMPHEAASELIFSPRCMQNRRTGWKPGAKGFSCKDGYANGGADRDRTGDPLLAKQVLSQLSYSPESQKRTHSMVGLGGLEPPTSRLSSARSNQLSYKPEYGPTTAGAATPWGGSGHARSLQRKRNVDGGLRHVCATA